MADKDYKPLSERVAKIEADMGWLKWISMGSFASSTTVAATLVAGVRPVQGILIGVLSFVVSVTADTIRVLMS